MGHSSMLVGMMTWVVLSTQLYSLDLIPSASVASHVVRLGDISKVSQDLADIPILATPGIGRWVVDGPRIRAADPRLRFMPVNGTCAVLRLGRPLPGDALVQAITARIRQQAGQTSGLDDVSVNVPIPPSDVMVPVGASIAIIAEPLAEGQGQHAWRVRILADGLEIQRRLVQVEMQRRRTVYIAARAIARDVVITAGDLVAVPLTLHGEHIHALDDVNLALGRRTVMAIPQGTPILPRYLLTPPLVSPGQQVVLVVRIKDLEVTTTATALGSGVVGDRISCRRHHDQVTVQATIQADARLLMGANSAKH